MSLGASPDLILTGFMGTGKTAVGREIARRTGRAFLDMDALLEAREGMPVAEIFRQRGEAYFRRRETELCRELAARDADTPRELSGRSAGRGLVIATGGGALLPDLNRELLSASGRVVCLTASLDAILHRLDDAQDRPLLPETGRRAHVTTLLEERQAAYRRIPLQVDTTSQTVEEMAGQILALSPPPPLHTLGVRYPGGSYPVHLGTGLLPRTGELLGSPAAPRQMVLVADPTVAGLYASTVLRSLEEAGHTAILHTVPEGEASKTLDTVRTLYDAFLEARLDREGVVVALGGGVVGDMAGFAAATYLRGVAFVPLPTTLLAMVDASVGGKVAVDHPRGKNLVGAFKQPDRVLADLATLGTLSPDQRANGLAEVIKSGLIADPALFEQIESYGPAPLPWLVERALRVKIAVVGEDPYERGRRAVLNLGHTVGHALELLSGYALPHGSAVSVGLVAAARLSAHLGFCDPSLPSRAERTLARVGLPIACLDVAPAQIWEAMATDKKRRAGRPRFVLLRDVGDVVLADHVGRNDLLDVLDTLQQS
jgi:shikimate kinase/3-dehydroquinate synthase